MALYRRVMRLAVVEVPGSQSGVVGSRRWLAAMECHDAVARSCAPRDARDVRGAKL